MSTQPPLPRDWRRRESPDRRRSWGRTLGLALAAVVAALGLVVFALLIFVVVAMATVGSNK